MARSNVLIIDDEEGFANALERRLTKRNMTVFTAGGGDEGLELLREHGEIEVVILDMKMPGKDGLAVLREIKEEFPLVQVVMLTGHATVSSAIEGVRSGACDYLMKPCDLETLTEKIREAAELKDLNEGRAAFERASEITLRHA